jgi:hypothetical protein
MDGGSNDGKCQGLAIEKYMAPGCGTEQPEPVCGTPGMLGCSVGFICNCDGTIRGYCELWSEKPWAYNLIPPSDGGRAAMDYFPDGGMSCDPTAPPPNAGDAGTDL